ncbi:MAG: hypothetical protein ABIJ05_04240 [Patescibacteria group bacterium]
MTTEAKKDTQGQGQFSENNGIRDPRFETPVMAINLTADSIPEEYQEHLKNGGDKIAG